MAHMVTFLYFIPSQMSVRKHVCTFTYVDTENHFSPNILSENIIFKNHNIGTCSSCKSFPTLLLRRQKGTGWPDEFVEKIDQNVAPNRLLSELIHYLPILRIKVAEKFGLLLRF
jgi:hypothetical protein